MELHLIIGHRIDILNLNIPTLNLTNNKIIVHDYSQEKIFNITKDIPEDSLVIIDAHGTIGNYNVDLFKDLYSIKHTLEKISNNKHINYELFACLSGAAIKMAPLPSTLITLSSENNTSIEYINNELINKSVSFISLDNPFIRFASYIFINPDKIQFSINRNKVNEIFTNYSIITINNYSIDSIKNQQLEILKLFLKFISNIKLGLDKKYHNIIEQAVNMKLDKNNSWLSQFNLLRYRELLLINMINLVKVDIVKKILESDVNVNAKLSSGANALYIAAQGISAMESLEQGDIQQAKKLEAGYLEIIKMLISKNITIDEPNNTGDTALLSSAQGGYLEALKTLITAGASINKQNNSGDTSLHIAVIKGKTVIVETLMKSGASITLQNKSGATAAYLAAQAGYYDIIDKLIKTEKSLVNIKINNGRSPLHIASQNGHANIVKLLLENKATVNNTDYSGISPLDIAIYICYEILDYFKNEIFSNNNIKYNDIVKIINLVNMKETTKSPLIESLKFIKNDPNNLTLADISRYINNTNYIIKELLDHGGKLIYFAIDSDAIEQLIREGEIFSSNPIIFLLSYNNQSDFSKIHNFDIIDHNNTKIIFT